MKKFALLGLMLFLSVNAVFAKDEVSAVVIPFESPIYVENSNMEDLTKNPIDYAVVPESSDNDGDIDFSPNYSEEENRIIQPQSEDSFEEEPIELDLSSKNIDRNSDIYKAKNPIIVVNSPDKSAGQNYKDTEYKLNTSLLVKNECQDLNCKNLPEHVIPPEVKEYYNASPYSNEKEGSFIISGKNTCFKLGLNKTFRF